MEPEFWKQRWQQRQIGFHLDQVNPNLLRHWHELGVRPGDKVFVPLCGKSLDLIWLLAQQHNVIGVECSSLAVQEFFTEQKIECTRRNHTPFEIFGAQNLAIWQGDFFELPAYVLENVAALYDRASLVALPPAMRQIYVQKLVQTLPLNARILLVTLEYNQQQMPGPPFSVTTDEVQALFGRRYNIRLMHETDILASEPRFAERGLDFMREKVYLLHSLP